MKPTAWAFLLAIVAGTGLNCTYDTSSLRGTGLDGGQDATANGTDGQAKLDGVVDTAVNMPDSSSRDTSSDIATADPIFVSKEVAGFYDWEFSRAWCAVRGGELPKFTPALKDRFLPNRYWTKLNDGSPNSGERGYVSDTGVLTANPSDDIKLITIVVCVKL